MNHAIILAGGRGTRFWPLSRYYEPKQFLKLYSSRSILEETLRRILPLVKRENIHIATGRPYRGKARRIAELLKIPYGNIFFEPEGRNTFAPIAVLSELIRRQDPQAVIITLPSDHFIKEAGKFRRLLREGAGIALKGYIVCFGIRPLRPETGYGYIKRGKRASGFYRIEKFIEKPGPGKAQRLIRDKGCFWNSGIFIFTPQVMLGEIKRLAPDAYATLLRIRGGVSAAKLWKRLPSLSIDYAIMEKSHRAALLSADCGWSDIGSWEEAANICGKDKNGNSFRGRVLNIGSSNTMAWSGKRLIAAVGLDNIIIVDTDDALLVCRKDMSQVIRKVPGMLVRKGLKGII